MFLSRVTSPTLPPLVTDGVAWHPYQHSQPPGEAGGKGVTGIGRIMRTQATIDTLFNDNSNLGGACPSRLHAPDCERPGLLFTEFGYLIQRSGTRRVHTEAKRVSLFTASLRRAMKYKAKWMVLYHAIELGKDFPPPNRDDYGLFAVDGAVRGERDYGKGQRQRRAFCDGIYNFALEKGYPVDRQLPC